jgi:hypothetical protein
MKKTKESILEGQWLPLIKPLPGTALRECCAMMLAIQGHEVGSPHAVKGSSLRGGSRFDNSGKPCTCCSCSMNAAWDKFRSGSTAYVFDCRLALFLHGVDAHVLARGNQDVGEVALVLDPPAAMSKFCAPESMQACTAMQRSAGQQSLM